MTAPKNIQVTKLRVIGRTGANGFPSYGEATFSDDKTYSFLWHPYDQTYILHTEKRTHGGTSWTCASFKSPKRVAALLRALH